MIIKEILLKFKNNEKNEWVNDGLFVAYNRDKKLFNYVSTCILKSYIVATLKN